jgi:multidrug resistance protein, MATE family
MFMARSSTPSGYAPPVVATNVVHLEERFQAVGRNPTKALRLDGPLAGEQTARPALFSEVRATVAVAAPLAAANLAQTAMGFTNTVMVGSLGSAALAAAGLGTSLYFTFAMVCSGVLTAVAPLAAHAIGAHDGRRAGRIARQGLVLAVLMAFPVVAGLMTAGRLLAMLGYDPVLAAEIGRFLRTIAWGAPGFLGFAVLRSFLVAASHGRAVMVVLILCVPMNAALNWLLIFGHLGAPALGIAGSGCSTAIIQWLMFASLALYARLMPSLAQYRIGSAVHRWNEVGRILRLGLPIGGILGLEIGVFATTGIMMGLLGADALGAHQLVMNCISVIFMIPLGISQTATVRVAVALGSDAPAAARRAAFVAIMLGVAYMALMAVVLLAIPQAVARIYIDIDAPANRGLATIALKLFAIAAVFQIFDGVQAIAAGALRGYRDTTVPLLLAIVGYWGIGFAGGWLLAFPVGWGPIGLWSGLAVGLAAVALMLTVRLYLSAERRAGDKEVMA